MFRQVEVKGALQNCSTVDEGVVFMLQGGFTDDHCDAKGVCAESSISSMERGGGIPN